MQIGQKNNKQYTLIEKYGEDFDPQLINIFLDNLDNLDNFYILEIL